MEVYRCLAVSLALLHLWMIPAGGTPLTHGLVRVRHQLCQSSPCRPWQQCVADNGGRGQAHCGCETQCAESKNSNRDVCASNGETYPSKCAMRRAGCEQHLRLRVISRGQCQGDPCATAQCGRSQICIPDPADQSRAKCICNYQCTTQINYVCGTNQRTYSNPCQLHKHACEQQANITVLHDGLCHFQPTEESSGVSPAGFDCSQCSQYTHCSLEEQRCVCPRCHNVNPAPVCGTDASNYISVCHLYQQACTNKRDTSLAYTGYCKDPIHELPRPCRGVQCQYGGVCEVRGSTGVCTCPRNCPNYEDFVCGTDGKTYRNRCILKQERCRRHSTNQVAKDGPCSPRDVTTSWPVTTPRPSSAAATIPPTGMMPTALTTPIGSGVDACNSITCPPGRECRVDADDQAYCACQTTCPFLGESVCGSDGETYLNECILRATSCTHERNLSVAHTGQCTIDPCRGVECPYNAECKAIAGYVTCQCTQNCSTTMELACGSDGDVYYNPCVMEKLSCQLKENITAVAMTHCQEPSSSGVPDLCRSLQCRYHGECVLNAVSGKAVCNCSRACPTERNPVCGKNGGLHIYHNHCIMENIACQLDENITAVSMQRCSPATTQHPTTAPVTTTTTTTVTTVATSVPPPPPTPPRCEICNDKLPLLVSFPRACNADMVASGKLNYSAASYIGEGIVEYPFDVGLYVKSPRINGRITAIPNIKIRLMSPCTCVSSSKEVLLAGQWVAGSSGDLASGHFDIDLASSRGIIEPFVKKPWKLWKGMYRYNRGLRQIVCRSNAS